MLEYIAVYVVRIWPPRPLLACSSAYFQAAGLRVPCDQAQRRAGSRSARPVGPLSAAPVHCRAQVFGGVVARPVARPVVGLENRPASHVLHTNYFFRNHRGRRVRFYAGAGVEPRPAVRCGLNRWRGAVEPRPPVWPAPVLRCVGIWGAGLRYRFAFARVVSERR